jgi:hypothetical protein
VQRNNAIVRSVSPLVTLRDRDVADHQLRRRVIEHASHPSWHERAVELVAAPCLLGRVDALVAHLGHRRFPASAAREQFHL